MTGNRLQATLATADGSIVGRVGVTVSETIGDAGDIIPGVSYTFVPSAPYTGEDGRGILTHHLYGVHQEERVAVRRITPRHLILRPL